MTERVAIPFARFNLNIFQLYHDSLLLTAGESGRFNTMTVGWGAIGVFWKKPMVLVAVRPSRYTYEFMENSDSFTVCAFSARYREALALLGSKSGRETDKIAEAGLTPCPSSRISAPGFAEAALIVESRKSYFHDLVPARCPPEAVDRYYRDGDYHRLYFGEILALHGEPAFLN